MISRRGLLSSLVATAGGVFVPEPLRAYSFLTNNPIATEWRDTVFVFDGRLWLAAQKERVRADWPTVTIGQGGPGSGIAGDFFLVNYRAVGVTIHKDPLRPNEGLFLA